MSPNLPSVQLNDGRSMPALGYGVWQVGPKEIVPSVLAAIEAGYRSIDTAKIYGNEAGVGEAVRQSGVPREELFITTKLWNPDHSRAVEAMDESLSRLGLSYVDLYLIHWPAPKQNLYVEAWKSLIEIQKSGKAKSIGVSNFTVANLQRVLDETEVVPAVNQIEVHPQLQQDELRAFHAQRGIITEAYSPIGRGESLLDDASLLEIARKHAKTAAQVVLRWHLELGLVAIPKTVKASRMKENLDLFGFQLDEQDMAAMAKLNIGKRLGGDPATSNYDV